jgi:hypothetical protein
VLRNNGQDTNYEFCRVWIIDRNELDAAIHQRGDEPDVAGNRSSLATTIAYDQVTGRAQKPSGAMLFLSALSFSKSLQQVFWHASAP